MGASARVARMRTAALSTIAVEQVNLDGWRYALVERKHPWAWVRVQGRRNRKRVLACALQSKPVDPVDAKRFMAILLKGES